MGGFEYEVNLPFNEKQGIKNPIFSKIGVEYLQNEWLKTCSMESQFCEHCLRSAKYVEINENRANISTENMRQKLVSKSMYADIVHIQQDIIDSQLSRIRRAHRSLKVLTI